MMQNSKQFRIVPLASVKDTIPLLARLFVEEWQPYYGPDGPGDAERDLYDCCRRGAIPYALVAMSGEDIVLGTAALKGESVGSELGVGPWLAALFVRTEHRNCGVGTELVAAIENEARKLGFDEIFVSTDEAGNIVRRRGWTQLTKSAESLRGAVAVYRKALAAGHR